MMRKLVRTSQFRRDFKKRILNVADEAALEDVLSRVTAILRSKIREARCETAT